MSETITVANHGRSDLTLPCGTRVPAGGRADVLVERLREHVTQPVTRHWFEERILRADGPVLAARPDFDCDCLATRGKLDEAEDKLKVLTDRLEGERAARTEGEALIASLTEARDAADKARGEAEKARAEAEDLAKLADAEIVRLQAALAEAEKAGKAKAAGK